MERIKNKIVIYNYTSVNTTNINAIAGSACVPAGVLINKMRAEGAHSHAMGAQASSPAL